MQTDAGLVRRALAGDRDGYVLLVRRYQHLVFGLFRNWLRCREDALDATQETFIVAYQRLDALRGRFRPEIFALIHVRYVVRSRHQLSQNG
jgi:RNA polymerase sigma-70 factor (ECF subfamily)